MSTRQIQGNQGPSKTTTIVAALALIAAIAIPIGHYIPTARRIGEPLYDKRVCAFYYTWYGNTTAYAGENPGSNSSLLHWNEGKNEPDCQIHHDPIADPWDISSAQHPSLGTGDVVLFDSGDPRAIRFHLDMAEHAGIDTMICTWWHRNGYEDYNFRQVLNITEADGRDMEHTVYFESVQDRFNASKYNLTTVAANIADDMKYIITSYGNHSKFLRIEGRPVIFVYAITSLHKNASVWQAAVDLLHDEGYNPFLIADLGGPNRVPDNLGMFDGFHSYTPLGLYRDEPQNALKKFETMILSARYARKLSCVTTLPGYNDTQVRCGVTPLPRFGGATYRASWDVALKSNPDWTLICSFNEWHEGTEIEPSIENGTFYVDMTRNYTDIFKN